MLQFLIIWRNIGSTSLHRQKETDFEAMELSILLVPGKKNCTIQIHQFHASWWIISDFGQYSIFTAFTVNGLSSKHLRFLVRLLRRILILCAIKWIICNERRRNWPMSSYLLKFGDVINKKYSTACAIARICLLNPPKLEANSIKYPSIIRVWFDLIRDIFRPSLSHRSDDKAKPCHEFGVIRVLRNSNDRRTDGSLFATALWWQQIEGLHEMICLHRFAF